MSLFRGKKRNSNGKKETNKRANGASSRRGNGSAGERRYLAMRAAARTDSDSAQTSSSLTGKAIQEVSREQSWVPPQEQGMPRSRWQDLPPGYGDNMIYVMVRDPYWVFAYWEIQKDHQERSAGQLGGNWNDIRSILRIYDLSFDRLSPSFFDITLQNNASNWYIQVEPNRRYVVEIGLLHRDGRFVLLARSNEVTTPRAGMSEIIDEQWMGIDFDKMYALSGGFELGKSSMELKKLMEERLMGAISSGSGLGVISSLASPVRKAKKRGFWFVLDCELIVYGATEPDATVTMQGKPVKLRPDGTFSLRFALPDGKLVLDTHAFSSDGVEERIITPIVERKTERPAPILRSDGKE